MAQVIDRALYGKPKEKYWISYIKQRIRNNKNFLGFVSGPTGSGKSYACLRIAKELDPEFTIERCVFGGIELMTLVNSGKLKKGSVVIFEEVGVEMSARNWASITNKMINYLLQTFRHRNFIFFLNSPFIDFVDAATRKLFHAEMSTLAIDFNKNEVLLKPLLIQYNSKLKKFYWKRLKVKTAEGKMPVDVWRVSKPGEELRKVYEEKKTRFTDNLNREILEELEAFRSKKNKKKELTEVQEEVLMMIEEGLNVKQMAILKDRTDGAIEVSMKYMRRKGYVFKPVFDNVKGDHRTIKHYKVIKPEIKAV